MTAHSEARVVPSSIFSATPRPCSGRIATKTASAPVLTATPGIAAISSEQGLGVALKIEDGTTRASECAVTAILARLGAIAADHPAAARRLTPAILNRRGLAVGAIRPDPAFWAGGGRL